MRLTTPTLFGPVATTIIKTFTERQRQLELLPFRLYAGTDTRKARSYQMILKIDSLSREIQRILTLTHCMRDFSEYFNRIQSRITHLRLVIPTPPPRWHSHRAATRHDYLAQAPFLRSRVPGRPFTKMHFDRH